MRMQHIGQDIAGGLPQTPLRSQRVCFLLLLPLGLFAASVAPVSAQQAPPEPPPAQAPAAPVYDGDWWLSLLSGEQNGVISGYQDCYVFEYHGSVPFDKPLPSYVDDLNKYFLADSTRTKQTVSEALDAVRGAASDSTLPAYKLANPPPPDQAVYDGRFWSDADPATKLGYVEGYLACHAAKLKDADAKFSRAPSDYVDGINQAYGTPENSDDTDKAAMRVATLLHSLKDPENPPAKPPPDLHR